MSGVIEFGHDTTIGVRVPPKNPATNFVALSGVAAAYALKPKADEPT